MERLIRWAVEKIAVIHSFLLSLNDRAPVGLNDKQLHLVVVGLSGMALFALTFLVFRLIERRFRHSTLIIAFIFSLTNLIVITFAIEIGQRITRTGVMEFMDIVYGLWGFIVLFSGYVLLLGLVSLVRRLRNRSLRRQADQSDADLPKR
jgi:hypothetical protein